MLQGLGINYFGGYRRSVWSRLPEPVQQRVVQLLIDLLQHEPDFSFVLRALASLTRLSFTLRREHQPLTAALMQRLADADAVAAGGASIEEILFYVRTIGVVWARDVPRDTQRTLYSALHQQLPRLLPQQVISVVYSFAKMGVLWSKLSVDMRKRLIDKVQEALADVDAVGLSNTLW